MESPQLNVEQVRSLMTAYAMFIAGNGLGRFPEIDIIYHEGMHGIMLSLKMDLPPRRLKGLPLDKDTQLPARAHEAYHNMRRQMIRHHITWRDYFASVGMPGPS